MLKEILVLIVFCLGGTLACFAQCETIPLSEQSKYRVRKVRLDSLFGRIPNDLKAKLEKHRNEPLGSGDEDFSISSGNSQSGADKYLVEIRSYLEEKNALLSDNSYGVIRKGGISLRATFASSCVSIVPVDDCLKSVSDDQGKPVSNCVDVTVTYKVIPIDTANPVSNLLDLARSNQLRFYRELPRPLLAFDPRLGFENDVTYGPSVTGSIKADLLSLPSLMTGSEPSVRRTRLDLVAHGRKSLKLPLFDGDAALSLSHSRPGSKLANLSIGLGYATERDGRGTSQLRREAVRFRGDGELLLSSQLVNRLTVGVSYRRNRARLARQNGVIENSVENVITSRLILDGEAGKGFLRGGFWLDHASRSEAAMSPYTKLSAAVGYGKNFSIGKSKCSILTDDVGPLCVFPKTNPPVVGVEVIAGLGRSWGTIPEHGRFFGGNGGGNFLYDAHDTPTLVDSPTGPLLRSIGRNQAGAGYMPSGTVGGTSYEYLSGSLSIPVRSWSRPLIPAIAISDRPNGPGCAGCGSLKDVLKNQVDKGRNIYIDALASQSLTPQQREDLALDPDDDLTPEELERLAQANAAFEAARIRVRPTADKVWSEITPTINFIADKANLYSIKPLIMFDVARISARDQALNHTRIGLGGGLQLNVVVAKFELGYIRALRRLPGDSHGNFVIRTVFEKLF